MRFRNINILSGQTSFLVTSFIVGVGAGFGAVVFRYLIKFFRFIFFEKGAEILSFLGNYYVIIIPAIGGILFGPLIYFFAREAKGHGVPEVMEAVELKGGRIRPIVAVVKSLASAICIGSGGSVGREGPIVQIGSSLGSTIGQILKLSEERIKNLVACGAAGGIAATFNAPIGGMLFALEVILRDFSKGMLGGVVVASVTASVIGRAFFGNQPSFAVPQYALKTPWELIFYAFLGILIAPFATLYIKAIYKSEDIFDRLPAHPLTKPVIGGLFLGVIGFFYPNVFGVGYETITEVLKNNLPFIIILILIPLKILATSLTLGSGGSGGVFAPSLFIGALLGGSYGVILSRIFPQMGISPGAYSLVGMAVLFTGAARAPLTSILILFELTGDYRIILPLMLSVVITTLLSDQLHHESIYTLKLIRRGIDIGKKKMHDILADIKVKEAPIQKIKTISPCTSLNEILYQFEENNVAILGVAENDNFYGIIGINDILTLSKYRGALEGLVIAQDLARWSEALEEEDNLRIALRRFLETGAEVLPVIRKENEKIKVIGTLSRHAILTVYSREVSKTRD